MFKQKHYLALGAVTLATLLLLSLPPRATSRLKLAVGSWFLPLFGLAGTVQQLPITAADSSCHDANCSAKLKIFAAKTSSFAFKPRSPPPSRGKTTNSARFSAGSGRRRGN